MSEKKMLYSSRVTGNLRRSADLLFITFLKKKESRWIRLDGGSSRISKK